MKAWMGVQLMAEALGVGVSRPMRHRRRLTQ
jgi:hypothetical protein